MTDTEDTSSLKSAAELQSQEAASSNVLKVSRHQLFEQALLKTADRFVGSIKFKMFMNHYREIYQRDPDSLKSIYEQFTGIVKKKVYKQLKRFSTEENFPQLLNNLDELLRERHDPNVTEAAWRPSGNPKKDLQPHIISVKLGAKTAVENMLHSLQDEDKLLTKEVLEKHDQRIELEKMLYDKLANFEKAALACQKLPLSEIRDWLAKLEDNSETPPA